jgi:hypothetical protein
VGAGEVRIREFLIPKIGRQRMGTVPISWVMRRSYSDVQGRRDFATSLLVPTLGRRQKVVFMNSCVGVFSQRRAGMNFSKDGFQGHLGVLLVVVRLAIQEILAENLARMNGSVRFHVGFSNARR